MSAVCVTVDVDAEAGLPEGGRHHAHRLTARSERTYGVTRGLPRLLDLLGELGVLATFYVPGITAQRHPDAIRAIVDAGHELGHHGHRHLATDTLAADEELAELHDGIGALEAVAGVRPRGYRSPAWELTPGTLRALGALGFAWDSSLMGDDRPHWIQANGRALLEFPVHWALDDAPHFERTVDPAGLAAVWRSELRHAQAEGRTVTFTLHPEILGRAHRIAVLRELLEDARDLGAPVLTHRAVLERERAAHR